MQVAEAGQVVCRGGHGVWAGSVSGSGRVSRQCVKAVCLGCSTSGGANSAEPHIVLPPAPSSHLVDPLPLGQQLVYILPLQQRVYIAATNAGQNMHSTYASPHGWKQHVKSPEPKRRSYEASGASTQLHRCRACASTSDDMMYCQSRLMAGSCN